MKRILCLVGLCAAISTAQAEIKTKAVEYKQGDVTLEGWHAYDDAVSGKRPAVLIIHQWKGLSDYEKKRAEMLAKLGYNVFALDIYGKGVRPATPQTAGAEAGKYKSDRALLRQRALAGLNVLKKNELTDPKRVAAIGYCFGGTSVIELARAGAGVAGVVSFHGSLDSPAPADGKNIKTRVLVCHGADDPFVPQKDINAFNAEMKDNQVDLQFIAYSGAVHSFTDWNADGAMKGAKYDEKADKRSWEHMKAFFAEIFK
ncbi:MAG: dienelactone hydrolase family protein [Opitutaceae bacterium]|nr:dienelactone hydrolase family protein [Verrucomicrobiales bacterium]